MFLNSIKKGKKEWEILNECNFSVGYPEERKHLIDLVTAGRDTNEFIYCLSCWNSGQAPSVLR